MKLIIYLAIVLILFSCSQAEMYDQSDLNTIQTSFAPIKVKASKNTLKKYLPFRLTYSYVDVSGRENNLIWFVENKNSSGKVILSNYLNL